MTWSAFHQSVEDELARLIAHYEATVKNNGSNLLLCEYLAPRVAAAIEAADTEGWLDGGGIDDGAAHRECILAALRSTGGGEK